MSDPETFLARWSRLKREATEQQTADIAADQLPPATADSAPSDQSERAKPDAPEGDIAPQFDPAQLPPIGSITAETDIRAFLQSGVPRELTNAALRRVWSADPAIRDFIGIAENQWDFTDPAAIPGFGPLESNGSIQELAARAMGDLSGLTEASESADFGGQGGEQSREYAASIAATPKISDASKINKEKDILDQKAEELQKSANCVALQQQVDLPESPASSPNRRTHGKALPQ